jgi:hypothetical protein
MDVKFIELKQRHVEAFAIELPDADKTRLVVYHGAVVRSAVKAGWILEPKIENVDDLNPGDVRKLAEAIIKEYARVMDIPPS